MYSVYEAADGRDISPEALRQAVKRGGIPGHTVEGHLRVRLEDVDAYLAQRDPARVKAGRANGQRAWSSRQNTKPKRQRLPTVDEILAITARPTLEEVTARDLMEARGIKQRRAQEILRQVRSKEIGETIVESDGETQHERVLRAIDAAGGSVDNPRQLMAAAKETSDWDKTMDDLVGTVWALQKRGLVTFIQRRAKGVPHGAHSKEITNITLTRRGAQEVRTLQNGELTRTWTDDYVERAVLGEEITAPVIDEETADVTPMSMEVTPQVMEVTEGESDTPTQYRSEILASYLSARIDLNNYPLIADLRGRRERISKYEAAAKLLEDFEEELVISLLEKIRLTPLETEVLRFLEELGM